VSSSAIPRYPQSIPRQNKASAKQGPIHYTGKPGAVWKTGSTSYTV